jgi:hypothetical protein
MCAAWRAWTKFKFALSQRRLAVAEMTTEQGGDFLEQEFHGVFDFVERKEEPAPASWVSPERRTEGRSRLPLRA